MGSHQEDRMEERAIRRKLGPAFAHTQLKSILDHAHELRERDDVRFDEALDIASGKTRRAYGMPKNP